MQHIHSAIALTDRSSVGEARRAVTTVAQSLGFSEERRNDLAIAATEASNNVVLHAKSGELLICPGSDEESLWIDMIALDTGPGIPDIPRAMEDGYSTIGTPGQGLGAIGRLADASSIYSSPEKGTAYWSRFMSHRGSTFPAWGVVSTPLKGEMVCGDGYFVLRKGPRAIYMVVDGLGHGAGAAEAAREAITVVSDSVDESASEITGRAHDALKKTRGAAMSIGIVDKERRLLTYSGVGNISAALITGTNARSLVSQNGTLGAALPRIVQEYTYPIEGHSLLMLYSDGLSSKTSISTYTGIQARHPALIAGILYRDFSRRRDDATVLVARMEDEPV